MLIVVDPLSKYNRFHPLHHPYSATTVAQVVEKVVHVLGIPCSMSYPYSATTVAQVFEEVVHLLGIPRSIVISIVFDMDKIFTSLILERALCHLNTQLRPSTNR